MKILIIQNCETESIDLYENYLIDHHVKHDIFSAYTNLRFPDINAYDVFIVGGTPISVRDIDHHPFLLKESLYLQKVIRMNKPVMGICFGSQLLAKLLGANVRKNTVMEIGVYQVRLTDAGRKSHLFRNFHASFPVFHWHRDTFDLPRRGRLLVEGDDCRNQAFSYKRVVGLQFHLEVTPKDSAEWINKYNQELINVNKSKSRIINECKAAEEEMKKFAYRLMDNFLCRNKTQFYKKSGITNKH